MTAVRVPDVLVRVSPKMLDRYNALAVLGAGRGRVVPLPYTFTRGVKRGFRNRDGTYSVAGTNIPVLEWPSTVTEAGILLEGARPNLVTDPENFGNWTLSGTPIRTGGQADPFGGTAAYLMEDDNAAGEEGVFQTVTFTGNGTKCIAVYLKGGTAARNQIGIWDNTAGTWRHWARIDWTAGVPTTFVTGVGAGTLFSIQTWGSGWYRFAITVDNVVAANINQFFIRCEGAVNVGTWYQYGASAWNAPFVSSYPVGADVFTLPVNFGPFDTTIYAKLARPGWADLSGIDLGFAPGVCGIGSSAPATGGQLRLGYQQAARTVESAIDTPTTDRTATSAIIAGTQSLCAQYRALASGGLTKVDAGAGFSSESAAATAFTAYNGQTLQVGRTAAGAELYGVLLDLIVARGLFTLSEMAAVP